MRKQYAILKRTIMGLLSTLVLTGATMRADAGITPVASEASAGRLADASRRFNRFQPSS